MIWARTVTCPNPQCRIQLPLVRSWWLGKKKGKEAYIVASVADGIVSFGVRNDPSGAPTPDNDGTMHRTGATCINCGSAVNLDYIRTEGRSSRIGQQLMAIVAEGKRSRVYLDPTAEHADAASLNRPDKGPEGELPNQALGFRVQNYGMTEWSDLFTNRQLVALTTLSELVSVARERVLADAVADGHDVGGRLSDNGTGAAAYADAVAVYLALIVSRLTDYQSAITTWASNPQMEILRNIFARQAIPMVWDFAEGNPLSDSSGSLARMIAAVEKAVATLPARRTGIATMANAATLNYSSTLISTDPPYYDNIGYSDLSDFFYVWLRQTVRDIYPDIFSTLLVPKSDELVANAFRHGGPAGAKKFFEDGFKSAFAQARNSASQQFPITVYYAFKPSESSLDGASSSGWETLLEGMVQSGWSITATWPLRSERGGRMISVGSNALASSIVLALRPRPDAAPTTDRRSFIASLQSDLPRALRELQQGAIAPVDLQQAAIGPGMAVFSRFAAVIESDGSKMTVRSALARINEVLDQVLSEQEGDFDSTTRFAIAWYRQYGYTTGPFGDANNMAQARNASVDSLQRAGILTSRAGKVALILPADLEDALIVSDDSKLSVWETLHRLIRALDAEGLTAAGRFLSDVGVKFRGGVDVDLVKELSFLLFSIADSNKWTKDAVAFNNLATSWSDAIAISRQIEPAEAEQSAFDFEEEE